MIEFKAKSLCKLRRRFSKTSRLLISETKIIIVITLSGYLTFRWLVREVSVDCIFGCLNILHIYSIDFFLWWLPTQNKRTFSKLYAFVQVFSVKSPCATTSATMSKIWSQYIAFCCLFQLPTKCFISWVFKTCVWDLGKQKDSLARMCIHCHKATISSQ